MGWQFDVTLDRLYCADPESVHSNDKFALAGAVVCLGFGVALVIIEPSALVETPVVFVAGFCLFEGSLALLSLMAAAGRPQPRWLS